VLSNAREYKLSDKRWDGVSNLLADAITFEHMIVGKRLKAGQLSIGQSPLPTRMPPPVRTTRCNAIWNDCGVIPRIVPAPGNCDNVVGSIARNGDKSASG
jgi:hypothetical protein